MISIREDDKKRNRYASIEKYTLQEALNILNPDNRIYTVAEKRGAFNIIKKEIERKNEMKKISFEELNQLNKILNQYSKEERQELLNSINADMEKSYTELQSNNWTITTVKGNPIFNLHKDKSE